MSRAKPSPAPKMTMRRALSDPALLGKVLEGDSWKPWRTILVAMMGEALTEDERVIFTRLTGRPSEPLEPVDEFWGIVGRRGGKSRSAAVLAIYQAVFVDHSKALVVGERPAVLCLAENQKQALVVYGYVTGILESTPMLAKLVTNKTQDTLSLSNGIDITVRAASFRGLRGLTNVCVIADEAAFWYDEASGSANSDEEILAAVRPSLATTGGPLIVISSPYAKKGAVYDAWRKHHGAENRDPRILVAQSSSRGINPSLPQSVVDRAMERDPVAASAEYGGQFRSDLEAFISRELVEAAVDRGVLVRPPRAGITYVGYADASSGTGRDSYGLGIVSLERRTSSTGRDRVDHGGGDRHDDIANAVAGALVCAAARKFEAPIVAPIIVSSGPRAPVPHGLTYFGGSAEERAYMDRRSRGFSFGG